jgi:FtsH-binding integral membrane protein
MSNESKWLTAIGGIVAAVVPLLIAYGLLTTEQGQLWQALVMAIAALIVPIVVGSVIKNYNDNEAALRVTEMELTQARLMASTRE